MNSENHLKCRYKIALTIVSIVLILYLVNVVKRPAPLPPGELYEQGALRFEKALAESGIVIDRRFWNCSFYNPDSYDPEAYTIFACGAEQDGKRYPFAIGMNTVGHMVWGEYEFGYPSNNPE